MSETTCLKCFGGHPFNSDGLSPKISEKIRGKSGLENRSDPPNTGKTSICQKKHDVHIISARNSGVGNGCANFMGAWHFLVVSAGKPPCPYNSSFEGGCWGFLRRGVWEVPIFCL